MDLQRDNIGRLYFKFLFPSMFSGLISSIYSLVDMIVVGQYEGPSGTAALACIAPFWTFFCCLSVLFGSGGAILFSTAKGKGNAQESRQAFTASITLVCVLSAAVWLIIALFDEPLLRLFGADEKIIPLALRYMRWLKLGIPLYPIGYSIAMFVRNDGSPTLAGASVVCGSVFNIFADIFLTFTCDLGIEGAAIATVAGQVIAVCILLAHFFSPKNTLAFVQIPSLIKRAKDILSIGLSTFLCDIGMGVLVILFNNQIMNYLGSNELAVYGIAGNIFTLIQTFSYGIGNAAQPILAENLGAGNRDRVDQTKRMGIGTAVTIGILVFGAAILLKTQIVNLYMKPSTAVLAIAPSILRKYFICLLFVPFNVFATYYLQAIQRAKESIMISVLRGFVLSGIFVYIFPALLGAESIWFAMLGAECVTAALAIYLLKTIH